MATLPKHQPQKTTKANSAERIEQLRKQSAGTRKITDQQILDARELRNEDGGRYSTTQIAKMFGVNRTTIDRRMRVLQMPMANVHHGAVTRDELGRLHPIVPESTQLSKIQLVGSPSAYVTTVQRGLDLVNRLLDLIPKVEKMLEACDEWLQDPEDPTKYDLGPRAEEIQITYFVKRADGRGKEKKRATLAALLARIETHSEEVFADAQFAGFEMFQDRRADPRTLLISAARELRGCLETGSTVQSQLTAAVAVQRFLKRCSDIIENAPATVKADILSAMADDQHLRELVGSLREQIGQSGAEGWN